VVLDGRLRLRLDSRLVASARQTPLWIITGTAAAAAREQALRTAGAEVLRVPAPGGRLDLGIVLECLAARGMTRLMVEAGPILAAALLDADLVDEAALLRSGKMIGPDGIDALEGLPLTSLTGSSRFELIRTERVGEDTIDLLARR
jgi:diaminohydroxyphosphoribosylaminopyrimidine deaminase/5-amino-6-(5-phosphoribosylamino)uracil reductase